jgi:hypothetical protein
MSESSQDDRPVIFWISMSPGSTGRGDAPADVPDRGTGHRDAAPVTARPATRASRPAGLYIPYRVLQVLAVLVAGGVVGLLVTLRWPQADAVLGTICAIIGAGLAVLDIMIRRSSGNDEP